MNLLEALERQEDGIVRIDEVDGALGSVADVRRVITSAFNANGVWCVWVQVDKRLDLETALKAGMVATTALDAPKPILAVTRWLHEHAKVQPSHA
jgi:hypothetical protein